MARRTATALKSKQAASPFPSRKPRKNSKFDEKREAVLATSARLFVESGYENTSLNDIAAALQITKPTIYYYVQGKAELLLIIKREAQSQLYEAIENAAAVDGSGLDKLLHLVPRYIEIFASDFGKCLVKIAPRVLDDPAREEVEERNAASMAKTMEFLRQGMEDGSIKQRPLKVTYYAVFGMLNYIARWYNPSGTIKLKQLTEDYVGILRDFLERE